MIDAYAKRTFDNLDKANVTEYTPIKMMRDFMIVFYNMIIMTSKWKEPNPIPGCGSIEVSGRYVHCFVPLRLKDAFLNMMCSYKNTIRLMITAPIMPNLDIADTGNMSEITIYEDTSSHAPSAILIAWDFPSDPKRPLRKHASTNISIALWVFSMYSRFGVDPKATIITVSHGDILQRQKWIYAYDRGKAAIVNPTNEHIQGLDDMNVQIHEAAGLDLSTFIKNANLRCSAGSAVHTSAFLLSASAGYEYIIHTVGPTERDPATLRNCYVSVLDDALYLNVSHIAFPIISPNSELYEVWPIAEIAKTAVGAIIDWIINIGRNLPMAEIRIVIRDNTPALEAFVNALKARTDDY
jgi:O-acetyl-ADP-ribose deacetylase (regulator of RNase III)